MNKIMDEIWAEVMSGKTSPEANDGKDGANTAIPSFVSDYSEEGKQKDIKEDNLAFEQMQKHTGVIAPEEVEKIEAPKTYNEIYEETSKDVLASDLARKGVSVFNFDKMMKESAKSFNMENWQKTKRIADAKASDNVSADDVDSTIKDIFAQTNKNDLVDVEDVLSSLRYKDAEGNTYYGFKGKRLYGDDLARDIVGNYVDERNHWINMADSAYREQWSQSKYGIPYEEYVKGRAEFLEEKFKPVAEAAEAYYEEQGKIPQMSLDGEPIVDNIALELGKLRSATNAFRDNTFWRGVEAGSVEAIRTATFDFGGVIVSAEQEDALDKYLKGEELNAKERLLVEMAKYSQILAEEKSKYRKGFDAADVGEGLIGSIGFMASLGAQSALGIGKSIGKGLAEQSVKQAFNSKIKEGIKLGVKKTSAWMGNTSARTALSTMPYQDYAQRRLSHFQFTDNGLMKEEVNPFADMYRAYASTFAEIAAEDFGGLLDDGMKAFGVKMADAKFFNKLSGSKFADRLKDFTPAQAVIGGLKGMKLNSMVGEVAEEYVTAAIQPLVTGEFFSTINEDGLMPAFNKHYADALTSEFALNTFAVCGALSAGGTLAKGVSGAMTAVEITNLRKDTKELLEGISDESLRNTLYTAINSNEAERFAPLAQMKWNSISADDASAALKVIFNDAKTHAMRGEAMETERLKVFSPYLLGAINKSYRGVDVANPTPTTEVVDAYALDEAGNEVPIGNVIYGDMDNPNAIVQVVDANGMVRNVPVAGTKFVRTSLSDYISEQYAMMFSTSISKERLNELIENVRGITKMDKEAYDKVLEENGFSVYRKGENVVLADGRFGTVRGGADSGSYIVDVTDANGNKTTELVGFESILHPTDLSMAEAQAEAQAEGSMDAPIVLPTTNDGRVSLDGINDGKVLARVLPSQMGGKQKAIEAIDAEIQRLEAEQGKPTKQTGLDAMAEANERAESTANRIKVLQDARKALAEEVETPIEQTPVEETVTPTAEEVESKRRERQAEMDAMSTFDFSRDYRRRNLNSEVSRNTLHKFIDNINEELKKVTDEAERKVLEHRKAQYEQTLKDMGAKKTIGEDAEFKALVEKASEALGLPIIVTDEPFANSRINGIHREGKDGNAIYINSRSTHTEQSVGVLAHEIVHEFKKFLTPEEWAKFEDVIMTARFGKDWANSEAYKKEIESIQDAERRSGHAEGVSDDKAREEAVAYAIQDYIFNGADGVRAFEAIVNQDLNWRDKLMEALRKVVDKLKSLFNGESKAVQEAIAEFENVFKRYAESEKINKVGDAEKKAVENANATDEVSHSLALADILESKSETYHQQNATNVPAKALVKANADIQAMVDIMRPYVDVEMYGAPVLPKEVYGKGLSTIFKNQSYGASMENTTICLRTLAYIEFVDDVKEKLGRPLTTEESFLASQMLYDIATDPQCLYCYVSLDRKAYDESFLSYLKQRDDVLKMYDAIEGRKTKKAIEEVYQTFLGGRKDTPQMKARFNMWIDAHKKGLPMITAEDLRNTKSIEVAEQSGDANIVKQIADAKKYAQSASWAKKIEDYRAYTGELLKISDKMYQRLNNAYGLRFYSFSEYSPAFIVENMQMMRDAALKGLRGLAYTKEIEFAKIFAPTNANINISIFGRRDADGNMVADTRQGADWVEAQALREQYPNVGLVFVATNDADVEWALAQDFIDVVIPFHIVRTGSNIADFYEWTNYKDMQEDKGGKSILPNEHNNDKETFLRLAEERGLTPRFSKWVDNPNYMKLVNETRRASKDTPFLQPIFNLDEAKASFKAFVDKGGYFGGWYNVDEQGYQDGVEQVYQDIVAGKTAKDVDYGRQDLPADALNTKRKVRQHNNVVLQSSNSLQKQPDTQEVVSDADVVEESFSISRNNEATIDKWLGKREDFTDEVKNAFKEYIADFKPATQLATTKWYANGVIRIPEDMPKVEQAMEIAQRKKVDALQYNSPMELIEQFGVVAPKEKLINPDDVPTLSNKVQVPNTDITIYDVENSEKSRKAFRELMNSHLGKESSPWCLLQADENGVLTKESARYWKHYNKYQKRAAFSNGKLVAFFASDDKPTWWDRMDKPHSEIPIVGKIKGDALGRTATMLYNESGEMVGYEDIHKGDMKNGLYERWHNLEQIERRGNFVNGLREGEFETWNANGVRLSYVVFANDLEKNAEMWNQDGELVLRRISEDDGRVGAKMFKNQMTLIKSGLQLYNFNKTHYISFSWDSNGNLAYIENNKENGSEEWKMYDYNQSYIGNGYNFDWTRKAFISNNTIAGVRFFKIDNWSILATFADDVEYEYDRGLIDHRRDEAFVDKIYNLPIGEKKFQVKITRSLDGGNIESGTIIDTTNLWNHTGYAEINNGNRTLSKDATDTMVDEILSEAMKRIDAISAVSVQVQEEANKQKARAEKIREMYHADKVADIESIEDVDKMLEKINNDLASTESFSLSRESFLAEPEVDRAFTSRQMDKIEGYVKENSPFDIAHTIDTYEKFATDEEKKRAQGKMSAIDEKYAQETINTYRAVSNYGRAVLAEKFPEYAANAHANNLKSGKTNLAMIRGLFQEYNSDEYMAELFDLVSSVAERFDTTFRLATIKGAHGNHIANMVQYNTATLNSGTISDQDKARIILHEMIHAATGEGIELCENARLREILKVHPSMKLRTSVRRLKTVLEDIRRDEEFKGEYGIYTVHEMLAELSNPRFVEKLKAHTIWTRIVDAIREIVSAVINLVTGKDITKSDAYTEVRSALTEIIEETPMEFIRGVTQLRNEGRIKGVKPLEAESVEEIASLAESEGTTSFSLVRDEAKIAELEASPKRIGYRNMVLNPDGTLSAPMAAYIARAKRTIDKKGKVGYTNDGGKITMEKTVFNQWEQADEHPELIGDDGKVVIYKPEKGESGIAVNYDPYIHSRLNKINSQFAAAWRRPDLVYVEVEIPTTDLESGYQAEGAALPVGAHEWSGGSGIVMLSMYDKPIRIVDWEEVADDWVKKYKDTGVQFNIIPPMLLPILAERGVEILPPEKKAKEKARVAYEEFKASRTEQESFSILREEDTDTIFATAKEEFASTNDWLKTGWLMPDGTQLDFAEGGDYRGTDHRAIGQAYKGVAEHQWQYLQDFESRGGIRIHMNRDGKYGTIEMTIKPTAEQKKRLRSFIGAVGGNVDVDFMDENYNTAHSASYEGVSPARVLSGITNFYDEGIKPKGNVSYSVNRLPKEEYAKLSSEIMMHQNVYNKPPFDYAFTDDKFYVYNYFGDGDFSVIFAADIEEDSDIIDIIIKGFRDGSINSARSIDSLLEGIKSGREGYSRHIADAVEKRGWDKNLYIPIPPRQSVDNARTPNVGNSDSTTTSSRGEDRQSVSLENSTKDSYSLNRTDIDYLDAVNRGDMVTAQKMVDEAAEKAGFTIRAYHGTPNKGYNADWVKSIEDIYSFVNPDKEGINSNAEYGTQEYREFWDFVTELRYGGYRSIKQELPDNLQRRYERGQTPPFTIFDKAYAGSSTGASDATGGFFFTPNIDFAQSFRFVYESDGLTGKIKVSSAGDGNIYSVYIKPQKVLDLTNLPAAESKLEQVKAVSAGADFDVIMNKVKNGRNKGKVEIEIMVKNPNLIKSADPVTYDDKGNIIPLSERFSENDDIRFSLSRDNTTVATPELEAEANPSADVTKSLIDAIRKEIEAKIDLIVNKKDITFEEIEKLLLDEDEETKEIRELTNVLNRTKATDEERKLATETLQNKYGLSVTEAKRKLREIGRTMSAIQQSTKGRYNRIIKSILSTLKTSPNNGIVDQDIAIWMRRSMTKVFLDIAEANLKASQKDSKTILTKKYEGKNKKGEKEGKGVDYVASRIIEDVQSFVKQFYQRKTKDGEVVVNLDDTTLLWGGIGQPNINTEIETLASEVEGMLLKLEEAINAGASQKELDEKKIAIQIAEGKKTLLETFRTMISIATDIAETEKNIKEVREELTELQAKEWRDIYNAKLLVEQSYSGRGDAADILSKLRKLGYADAIEAQKAIEQYEDKIEALKGEIYGYQRQLASEKMALLDAMKAFNTAMYGVEKEGRIALKAEKAQRKEDMTNWRVGILRSVRSPLFANTVDYNERDKKIDNANGRKYTRAEDFLLRNRGNGFLTELVDTMEYVARKADVMSIPNAWLPYGFYYQMILHPEYGLMARADWRYHTERAIRALLDLMVRKFTGYDSVDKLSNILNKELGITYNVAETDQDGNVKPSADMSAHSFTVDEALYIRAAIKQDGIIGGYLTAGLTTDQINNIVAEVERRYPRLCALADWIQGVDGIYERLYTMNNEVYRKKNGRDLDHTENYEPVVRKQGTVPTETNLGETMSASRMANGIGSNKKRVRNNIAMDLNARFFDVLDGHISDVIQWVAYADLFDKMNNLLGSPLFRKMIQVQGLSKTNLENCFLRATGERLGNSESGRGAKIINTAVRNVVAANVVGNLNTALKQFAGITAALSTNISPEIYYHFLKNFPLITNITTAIEKGWRAAKGDDIHKEMDIVRSNYTWALKNIPTFAERVDSGNMGMEIFQRDGLENWKKVSDWLKKYGMAANKFMDTIVSASVAKTIYEMEYKKLRRRGLTHDKAHDDARFMAAVLVNQTQQSDQGAFLSEMQSDRKGVAGTLAYTGLTAYNNNQLAMDRNARAAIINMISLTSDGGSTQRVAMLAEEYENRGLDSKAARRWAKWDLTAALLTQGKLFLHNTTINPILWQALPNAIVALTGLVASSVEGGGDDDEAVDMIMQKQLKEFAEKVLERGWVYLLPTSNIVGVKDVADAYFTQGKDIRAMDLFGGKSSVVLQPLARFIDTVRKYNETKGNSDIDSRITSFGLALAIIDTATRYGLGVSTKTMVRMCEGMYDALTKHEVEDFMNATTQSGVLTKLYASSPRKGETMGQYTERVAGVYKIVDGYSKAIDMDSFRKQYVDRMDEIMLYNTDIDYDKFKEDMKEVKKMLTNIPVDKNGEPEEDVVAPSAEEAWRGYRLRIQNSYLNEYKKDLKDNQNWDEEGAEKRKMYYRRLNEAMQEFINLYNADSSKVDELALDMTLNHYIYIGKREGNSNREINQYIREEKRYWNIDKKEFIDNYNKQWNNNKE